MAVVWLGLGLVLADITGRVADWFVMTDELLYERLALSVDRTGSLLPHIHGKLIGNVNQLYPLLLATVFGHGTVGTDLHRAHVLNAFVMTSVAIPAFVLARRVSGSDWAALVVAVCCVAVPWIALSSFLLTEVVAYPVFVWALLACQSALAQPSRRNDLLAVGGLVLAVLARTQLAVLLVALPLALLVEALAADAPTGERRPVAAGRNVWRRHRVLVVAYGAGALAGIVLVASGRNPLGTYSQTASGNIFTGDILQQVVAHLAAVATGMALLPFVLGAAWLVGNLRGADTPERRIFARLATITIVLLAFEVSSFDSRFGQGLVRDRYLFYIAPPLLVAFAAALTGRRWPRWSLAVPVALLTLGFLEWPLPTFTKLNVDTPASILDDYLRRSLGGLDGARGVLIAATVLCALLVVEGGLLLKRRTVAAILAAIVVVLMPLESSYAFVRLFRVDGTSGFPITLDQSQVLGWVDRAVGPNVGVTMIPYPAVPGDYWAGVAYWWDLEFWNKSVDGNAGRPGDFEGTPPTFPKTYLRFDPVTGRANVSPKTDVAQLISDARFHIAGSTILFYRNAFLVQPEQPWRADWVTAGLFDDGWTQPGTPARIRVFGYPGQRGAVTRSLQVSLTAPAGVSARPYAIRSNAGSWERSSSDQGTTQSLTMCVPAHGAATATLTTTQASAVYGDPTTEQLFFGASRRAGLLVTRIYLSGDIGAACTP